MRSLYDLLLKSYILNYRQFFIVAGTIMILAVYLEELDDSVYIKEEEGKIVE